MKAEAGEQLLIPSWQLLHFHLPLHHSACANQSDNYGALWMQKRHSLLQAWPGA